ncbi:MAG: PhzF family phenazine biosynthesis protein [Ignavibacteriae bacterium]|nr:PhzF family phenazine biosynthesis protein [Ignavibacteriota bacterium]
MGVAEPLQNLPRSAALGKEHKKIAIKQVDAFTEVPLTGNPAGVVVNAAGLTDQQMQTIAREMSVSETAFILPATLPGADLRVRWFTPVTEVSLCGHATIGSFHALSEEGMYGMKGPGSYSFNIETKSGMLPVVVEKTLNDTEIFFGLIVPEFVRAAQYKLDLMRILNVPLEEFDSRLPIVVAEDLFVPIRRLHTIFAMKPNFFALSQLLTNRKLRGVCVFTTETIERRSAVHSRFFAPNVGINEDPVTGSANGPLGVYLFEQGQVEPVGDMVTLIGEQGDVIGRKGRVIIQLTIKGTQVMSVRIGGRAVTTLDGEMIIP